MPGIRLVTFDVLWTLIKPRKPIFVQYQEVFKPHLGMLSVHRIQESFSGAIKKARTEFPAYTNGHVDWWTEVIKTTALGAGGDPQAVRENLGSIVTRLLDRFSSSEGYEAYPDAIPTLLGLREVGLEIGIISNGDSRFRQVLESLEFPFRFGADPIYLSEIGGYAKPDPRAFAETLDWRNQRAVEGESITAKHCLHVGDSLSEDYRGAQGAGFEALWLKRTGVEAEGELEEEGVESIRNLTEVAAKLKIRGGIIDSEGRV